MARIWCHLTTRTVPTEWQPMLTRVVSVSTGRVSYAKMSLIAQNEIDCYIGFRWIGHLVEVQEKTDPYGYVNILQHNLLASAVDIFKNQISFSTWTIPLTDRVSGFPAWWLEFSTGAVTWIFPRYEYHRSGNGMHHAQIEQGATYECFITLSLCPTGLGETTKGIMKSSLTFASSDGRTSPGASPPNKIWMACVSVLSCLAAHL